MFSIFLDRGPFKRRRIIKSPTFSLLHIRKNRIVAVGFGLYFCYMKVHHHYDRIAAAIRFLTENQGNQPTLAEAAAHVHLSKYHFQRIFQEWAGVTPKQFVRYLTHEYAREALRDGKTTLATAHAAGLSGTGRLHDLFVEFQGCTPGEWKLRGRNVNIRYSVVESPFGPALAAETERGLCHLSFLENGDEPALLLQSEFSDATISNALAPQAKAVAAFFNNLEARPATIKLDLKGTSFQMNVWRALLTIPTADLRSYGQIARAVDRPAAARAVGTAIGKNPIAYLIPCHRVLRESGHLGGYRWGTNRKLAITGFEAARLR